MGTSETPAQRYRELIETAKMRKLTDAEFDALAAEHYLRTLIEMQAPVLSAQIRDGA